MALTLKRGDINFTEGGILKALVLFALPIMAGEVLQNLYNSVDTLIVGNFVGDAALAAVGVCSTLSNLLVGFFNGMSIGGSVVISRNFGSGDKEKCLASVRHTFTFSVVLGVVLSVLGILLAPALLRLSGANQEIFEAAAVYLRIYLAGLMFTVMYNCGAGALRAVGDSRTPFTILTISSVINIGLDVLFVAVLPWGIVGVALATVISQSVSVLLVCRTISKRLGTRCIDIRDTFLNGKKTVLEALDIGFAAGLQGSLITFSNLFVWRYINMFSTTAVAGISVANRIDKFVNLPAKAFGLSMTTFVSQNVGAKRYERMRSGIWRCTLLACGVVGFMMLLIYTNAPVLAGLFTRDEAVVTVCVGMMRTIMPFYFAMTVREIFLGVLRGNGYSRVPMILSLVGMVACRQTFLAIMLHRAMDIRYIFFGYPVGWVCAALLLFVYAFIMRRKIHLTREPAAGEPLEG